MPGWKEHVQTHIAKSFIVSVMSKEIASNPEVDMENMIQIVVDHIQENFKYGFLDFDMNE